MVDRSESNRIEAAPNWPPPAARASGGLQRWEKATNKWLLVLALAFLPVLVVPLAVDLSRQAFIAFEVANYAIWAAFAIDYLTRLYLSPERGDFVRHNVVDLIVVAVPFLRPFRLLRLFAITATAARRAGPNLARQTTAFVTVIAAVLATAAAFFVLDVEEGHADSNIATLGDALWWSIVTVTTVGYGDHFPVSAWGRVFAGLLMVVGIALIGTITAAVAAWFVRAGGSEPEQESLNSVQMELAELRAVVVAIAASQGVAVPEARSADD